MARVACLGAALQDTYLIDRKDFHAVSFGQVSIFDKLEMGVKLDIEHIAHHIGGGGANAAVSFARHGHETILLTQIAHDPCGDTVLNLLDRENIDSSYVRHTDKYQTGYSVILLDSHKGERTILTHRGAAEHFDVDFADDLENIHPDWLYITTVGGNFELLEQICHQAKQLNCRIMLNPGQKELQNAEALVRILGQVDILLVNRAEAMQIVEGELLSELLERLCQHVDTVILTAGPMGGIATDGIDKIRFGLYEDRKLVDSTGAGDAFGAGFLAHYAEHSNFQDALIFASANSTAVIGKIGSQAGILTGAEKLHPMPLQTCD